MSSVVTPNEMQQKAIDILKGQVMLLAGPGTGKTFTVIHRIEKMLADGVEPSSILCLTYSDAAANEMRQRLIKKMGVVASSVDIYTYHSFCNDIIKTYPSQFDLSVGVRVITETEKIALMKESIDKVKPQYFAPPRGDRYYFTKSFVGHIEKLKSKRITKEDYLNSIIQNAVQLTTYHGSKGREFEFVYLPNLISKGYYTTEQIKEIVDNVDNNPRIQEIINATTIDKEGNQVFAYKGNTISDFINGKELKPQPIILCYKRGNRYIKQ